MASTLLALLDDIATILDDVAVLSKVAAKKTAGVLGDDLALNAQQVSGVRAERELPVVWAVAKGSAVNKAIIVPVAILLSVFLPSLIMPLLMLGGLFLCFEGFEKIAHKLLHSKEEIKAHHQELITEMVENPEANLADLERDKIKGAVRTDFILSAEIVVISLGTVATSPLVTRISVLVAISILMTVGVYGLVAGIVKIDDAGQHLVERANRFAQMVGRGLLGLAPRLMKTLAVLGTAAMFLVGGGIIVHGWPWLHHAIEGLTATMGTWPAGGVWTALFPSVAAGLAGVIAGGLVVVVVELAKKLRPKKASASQPV